jgi:hypothetical protein
MAIVTADYLAVNRNGCAELTIVFIEQLYSLSHSLHYSSQAVLVIEWP